MMSPHLSMPWQRYRIDYVSKTWWQVQGRKHFAKQSKVIRDSWKVGNYGHNHYDNKPFRIIERR